jgi:hypothetical protein
MSITMTGPDFSASPNQKNMFIEEEQITIAEVDIEQEQD